MNAKTIPPITVENPGILWHLDVTYSKGNAVMMIYDEYTSRAYIKILPKNQFIPIELENFLRTSIMVNGCPDTVMTDNSTYFQDKELKHLLKRNNIEHATYSPYQAKTGKFERILRILEPLFREAKMEVTLKVDVSKGRASIKDEAQDPFREALLSIHMDVSRDSHGMEYNSTEMRNYLKNLLKKIEYMCNVIDPDLFRNTQEGA